jgi:hypothetical protein
MPNGAAGRWRRDGNWNALPEWAAATMKPCELAKASLDAMDEANDADPAVVISATLYLMSCHACNRCPRLAVIVSRHLRAIAQLDTVAEPLRATCRRLCVHWEQMAQPPAEPTWIERLAGRTTH